MENRIKRKLVCTGWILDISTSTTNARKKLLIDFRGRICSGKGGCKCGNCRVRQPQALRVTTFPMQITRQDLTRFAIQAKGPDGKWTRKPLAYRESNNVHLLIARPPEICVNLVFKHIHAASSCTICRQFVPFIYCPL